MSPRKKWEPGERAFTRFYKTMLGERLVSLKWEPQLVSHKAAWAAAEGAQAELKAALKKLMKVSVTTAEVEAVLEECRGVLKLVKQREENVCRFCGGDSRKCYPRHASGKSCS